MYYEVTIESFEGPAIQSDAHNLVGLHASKEQKCGFSRQMVMVPEISLTIWGVDGIRTVTYADAMKLQRLSMRIRSQSTS